MEPVSPARRAPRRTKIVCTLGPATADPAVLAALVAGGMDVARLNFSHGRPGEHEATAAALRAAAAAAGRDVALLADLPGPKIRVGAFAGGGVDLAAGAAFTLTPHDRIGDASGASVSYAGLAADVRPGDAVLLDDGRLRLEVVDVAGADVRTRVVTGGRLTDRKGVNLPGVPLGVPVLTERDREALAAAVRAGVDWIALSFVRRAADPEEVRRLAPGIPVIAKLEKPEAVARLEDIVAAADGILVARGDLGVELGFEKVPLLQKRAIEVANRQGKLVVTATQMLESMTAAPQPTRAEVSDVANAVLDGSDALMLSGETAIGRDPCQALAAMVRIVEEVEASPLARRLAEPEVDLAVPRNALAHAAVVAARHLRAPAIAACTDSGYSAELISDYRPAALIVAYARDPAVRRRLAPFWGVWPRPLPPAAGPPDLGAEVARDLLAAGLAAAGDRVPVTFPAALCGGHANALVLHRVDG